MLVVEEGLKQQKDFQKAWPFARLKNISLEEYTDLKENNSDYFCYWIEFGTYKTGGIGGGSAYKFGIYRKKNIKKAEADRFLSDNKYSWLANYGKTKQIAFKNVKNIIVDIAKSSIDKDFSNIDDIDYFEMIKWKIAFLYNSQNLIPIFKREVLVKIAVDQGMNVTKKTRISELQKHIFNNKPPKISTLEYADNLWNKYSDKKVVKRYWGGGIYWDNKIDKSPEFIRGNYWQVGWGRDDKRQGAKQAWKFFDQIKIGDELAMKGYGGRHDLIIHYIGEVIKISYVRNFL